MSRGRLAGNGLLLTAAAAALVTAAVFYVQSGSFVLVRLVSSKWQSHIDFETFWKSAVALLRGSDIYNNGAVMTNLNPPAMTLALAPLGWLGFWPAYRLFTLVSVVLVVGSLLVVAAELRLRPAAAGIATVAVLLSSPVLGTLGLGQVYPLLLAGLVAAWLCDRRGYPAAAGVALGVVVALKPSLAPILLLPLVRRQWDTLTAAIATAGAVTVAGWWVAGPESLPHWARTVAAHPIQTYVDNASLVGAAQRLTAPSEGAVPLVEVPGGATVGFLLGLVMLAVTVWRARHPTAGPDPALWAVTAAALLVSPLSWHNYLLLLTPGVFVLLARGRWPVAALLLSLGLIGMEWQWAWGDPASALAMSLYCGILLAHWVCLAALTGRLVPHRLVEQPLEPHHPVDGEERHPTDRVPGGAVAGGQQHPQRGGHVEQGETEQEQFGYSGERHRSSR